MRTKGSKNKSVRSDIGQKRRSKYSQRLCPICSELFQPENSTRKYCSNPCRHEGLKKHITRRTPGHDTTAYKTWRSKVLIRDDYTCQVCKTKGGELRAHHIYPWARFPEKRYELATGITLCKKCHDLLHWAMERNEAKCKHCGERSTEIYHGDKLILVSSIYQRENL